MKNLCDFIVFSDDWGRFPSSCQHLMKRFLSQNKVLWVNSIGLRSPSLSAYDLKRICQKLKEWGKSTQEHEIDNLDIVSPISLPWNQFNGIRKFNKSLGINALSKKINSLTSTKRVSLATVPNACDWIGNLDESLKVYYCVDDFSKWPGMDKKTILKMEQELLNKVDLYVATSKKLYDRKDIPNIPKLFLPHGVEVEHFSNSSNKVETNSFPSIGFFGMLDKRLDYELISALSEKRSHWKWVFMGPKQYFPKNIEKRANISVFPPSSYEELPLELKKVDILFLPYKMNDLSNALNPLKLRECLATGKPVVASPIPEVVKYKKWLKLGGTLEEWLHSMDEVVAGYKKWNSQKQINEMKQESWESRADTLAQKIEKML